MISMSFTRSVWVRMAAPAALVATWSGAASHRTVGVEVTTAAVTRGSVVHRIVATGDLRAVDTVPVGAQLSGTVLQIYVDYNAIVRAGQPLAKIDPAIFEAQLRE